MGTVSFSYSLDRVCLIIELNTGKSTTITANTNTSLRRLLLLGRLASVPSWSDRLLQPEWTAAVGQESEERKYLAFVSHFKLECQAETYLYSLLQFADLLYYAPIRRGQHCAALHSLVRRWGHNNDAIRLGHGRAEAVQLATLRQWEFVDGKCKLTDRKKEKK